MLLLQQLLLLDCRLVLLSLPQLPVPLRWARRTSLSTASQPAR